jgi:hypothetical protein
VDYDPSNEDYGAVTTEGYTPVAVTRIYTGLPAGLHNVSIWVRGLPAHYCDENSGNYTQQVIVKEY